MKLILIPALLLSFAVVAQTPRPLPLIGSPAELASGEYAEGTVTRMTAEDVAQFLPWAQNARNQLARTLNQARNLPLRERPAHIERAVRAVVARSGGRQYQMFLRFALNRGMLLVDELERNVNMNEIGSQESALDLLQKAIEVGLEFYESDLAFQERAQSGDTAIVMPYARFGVAFMQKMYPGVVNVLDAGAQYRLLFKLIEMTNWDLSRDAQAARYAETIVEAYEMTVDLPEQPSQDDRANLRMIRRLNGLKIVAPRPDQVAPAVVATPQVVAPPVAQPARRDEFDGSITAGGKAFDSGSNVVRTVRAVAGDTIIFTDGVSRTRNYVVGLVQRSNEIEVGGKALDSGNNVVRTVKYIATNGTVVFEDGVVRASQWVQSVGATVDGVRAGDMALDTGSNVVRRVAYVSSSEVFIFSDGVVRTRTYVQRLVDSYNGVGKNTQAYDSGTGVLRTVRYISSGGIFIFTDGVVRTSNYVQAVQ